MSTAEVSENAITERDRLTAACADRLLDRDLYVKGSGPWKARDRAFDRALAALFALGPAERPTC